MNWGMAVSASASRYSIREHRTRSCESGALPVRGRRGRCADFDGSCSKTMATSGARSRWSGFAVLVASCLALSGCDTDDKAEPVATPKVTKKDLVTYPSDGLTQVSITLAEASWEILRYQGADLTTHGCDVKFPYDSFDATIAVDSAAAEGATVRKKGSLGSLSLLRPSLKLNFTNEALFGATLNNNRQDPTNAHQCITYALFAKAGLPAPRCALAHVKVNERDLGIYTHVEEMKKPFLERTFGDDSGNLYEGESGDFTAERQAFLVPKTNEQAGDTSDLSLVTAALAADDSQLEAALGRVIALDEFLSFWAMEVLTGHRDGYSGDTANFYVYHNPKDGLFHFIVSGADNSLVEHTTSYLPGQAISVYVKGAVSARLYAHPEMRRRYQQRLRELIDAVWVESELIEEVQHWTTLAQTAPAAIEPLVTFIQSRRGKLLEELDSGGGSLAVPSTLCRQSEVLPSSGSIDVTWGDPGSKPSAAVVSELILPLNGEPLAFVDGTVQGYAQLDEIDADQVNVKLFGALKNGRIFGIGFKIPTAELVAGQHFFHGNESIGGVAEISLPTMTQGPILEVLSSGTYNIDGTTVPTAGAPLRISWNAKAIPWSLMPATQ